MGKLTMLILGTGMILAGVVLAQTQPPAATTNPSENPVKVKVFNKLGELIEVDSPRVEKTDAEWKKLLTPEQYKVARNKGTEAAFCGTLLQNHQEGVYSCICCGLPLFASNSKFDSGTGWPSFFSPSPRKMFCSTKTQATEWFAKKVCARGAAPTSGTFSTMVRVRQGCASA